MNEGRNTIEASSKNDKVWEKRPGHQGVVIRSSGSALPLTSKAVLIAHWAEFFLFSTNYRPRHYFIPGPLETVLGGTVYDMELKPYVMTTTPSWWSADVKITVVVSYISLFLSEVALLGWHVSSRLLIDEARIRWYQKINIASIMHLNQRPSPWLLYFTWRRQSCIINVILWNQSYITDTPIDSDPDTTCKVSLKQLKDRSLLMSPMNFDNILLITPVEWEF